MERKRLVGSGSGKKRKLSYKQLTEKTCKKDEMLVE